MMDDERPSYLNLLALCCSELTLGFFVVVNVKLWKQTMVYIDKGIENFG
jgi:hypothetical protein